MMLVLCTYVIIDFSILGLARRTFVFYTMNDGKMIVEERNLKRSASQEQSLTRYIEEAVLGPVGPEILPLFTRGTRLLSLLYRDGKVFLNFSPEAALPPEEGGDVFNNLCTLYIGIKRNFPWVNDIVFFIDGKEAFPGKFKDFSEKIDI